MKTRYLVTGGSGFIGTNLIEEIIRNGDEVINFDTPPPRNKLHSLYWKKIDILDELPLISAVKNFNPEIIIHLAARTDLDGVTVDDYIANTDGVRNILSAIKNLNNLKIVIFASSRLVCEIGYNPKHDLDFKPSTPYGESKVLGENLIRANCTSIPSAWTIVRPTSIWGPWFDIPYKTFFLLIKNGRYIHPGQKRIPKSFGYVGNTVFQLLSIAKAKKEAVSGKVLYLADYDPIDVLDFAETIKTKLCAPNIMKINYRALKLAAYIGDFFKFLGWRNVPLTTFRLNNLITPMVYDLTQLQKITGKPPYSINEGIDITVNWITASNNEIQNKK